MIGVHKSEAKQLLRGVLPYLILKCAESQSIHGYELIKVMRERFGVYFGPSTIYPLLKQLEAEGMLTTQWTTMLRPRKIYTITSDGKATVEGFTFTMQAVAKFEGQIRREPQKLELHNIITLQ